MAPLMVDGVSLASPVAAKPFSKRIRDANSIFHRFWMDFGTHFGDILMIWATFLTFCIARVASFCKLLALK